MAQRKFAAFDIDGTLIRWQLYHTMVDKLAKAGVLGKEAHKELHEARMRWKRRENTESFRDYEHTLVDVYGKAVANISTKLFDQYTNEVIDEYRDQIYTYTRDLIKNLKKQGYVLLAISGSHQELVEQIALHYGFDFFIGTQYERKGGNFSGKVFVPSLDKKAALNSFIKQHDLSLKGSLAIGDSLSDASMLEMVEKPIAFNPEKRLFDEAKAKHWTVVIERKNVIYTLKDQDGTYILAEARSY